MESKRITINFIGHMVTKTLDLTEFSEIDNPRILFVSYGDDGETDEITYEYTNSDHTAHIIPGPPIPNDAVMTRLNVSYEVIGQGKEGNLEIETSIVPTPKESGYKEAEDESYTLVMSHATRKDSWEAICRNDISGDITEIIKVSTEYEFQSHGVQVTVNGETTSTGNDIDIERNYPLKGLIPGEINTLDFEVEEKRGTLSCVIAFNASTSPANIWYKDTSNNIHSLRSGSMIRTSEGLKPIQGVWYNNGELKKC